MLTSVDQISSSLALTSQNSGDKSHSLSVEAGCEGSDSLTAAIDAIIHL